MMARQGNGATASAQPPAQRQQTQSPATVGSANDLERWLAGYEPKIGKALPQTLGMSGQQFLDMAMLAIRRLDPEVRRKVLACDKATILFAIQEAASFGFRLGGSMAEGYLIPYGTECTFQPDYKGLLKLARRSGVFRVIEAVEVFEKETFNYYRDPHPHPHHVPILFGDKGALIGVYAYAELTNGSPVFEAMDLQEINKVRQQSKAPNSPAWRNWYGQMAMKAVLKRMLKRQERSIELTKAIEADDREYQGDRPGSTTATVAPQRGIAGLRSQLGIGESPLPPQPSVVYSEAEEEAAAEGETDDPDAGPDAARDAERFGDDWAKGRE